MFGGWLLRRGWKVAAQEGVIASKTPLKSRSFNSTFSVFRRAFSSLNPTAAKSKMSILKKVSWTIGALIGTPLVATSIYAVQDENMSRSIKFWWNVFPIYIKYRQVEAKVKDLSDEEQTLAFEELHDKYAPEMLRIILFMKGFYIKVGQLGSSRPDFVPKQYVKVLTTLQDSVPTEPFSYVRGVVEESLGKPLNQMFSFFDEEPLGAASIGQVHRAKLLDGTEVVVKVKFPSVERLFDGDMQTITDFCELAQPEQVPFLKEVRKQFLTEFDYVNEAHNLQQVKKNMAVFSKDVEVPSPIMHLCTRDVLVMTYLPGVKLVDGIKTYMGKVAKARNTTVEAMQEERRRKMEAGILETGPSVNKMRLYAILEFSQTYAYNTYALFYNYTLGWVLPAIAYKQPEPPLNIPYILDKLVEVHGHQIFVNGFFNGDPHPGNIMLLDNGKLGLIDFGQMKTITPSQRLELAALIIALGIGDNDAVFELHAKMGFKTEKDSLYVSVQAATIGFDRDDRVTTEGMNLQQYIEHLGKHDKIEAGADDFIMASRASILLRGLGCHLQYPMRTSMKWRQLAQNVLLEHNTTFEEIVRHTKQWRIQRDLESR
eukprot:m.54574 g.54574  ORF g.54574 m.54574 type:complete len:598 (-) comp7721_c0_seq1:205-1998(-)